MTNRHKLLAIQPQQKNLYLKEVQFILIKHDGIAVFAYTANSLIKKLRRAL